MKKSNFSPKKSKLYFVIWVILFLSFSIASRIYVSYQQEIIGHDPTIILSSFQLFTLCMILIVFIPLLIFVHYYAQKSGQNKIRKITRMLLWLLIAWTCCMALITILAYFAPGYLI